MNRRKILKKCEEANSLTVDIFDTLLLRKKWPEELQFLEVADEWVSIFNTYFGYEFTAYEFLSYRIDARRVLQQSKKILEINEEHDTAIVGITEWFNLIIDVLSDRCGIVISANKKQKLVKAMIHTELQCEEKNLFPNRKLVKQLKKIRKKFPDKKIFFLSDMYLRSNDIKQLLKFFGIDDLFDGGFTSSDMRRGKWSGKLHSYYLEVSGSRNNLHIGDNYQSDYKMAIKSGSNAVHLVLFRNIVVRRAQSFIGKKKLKRIREVHLKAGYSILKKSYTNDQEQAAFIFSFPLIAYLGEMRWMGLFCNVKFLAISSESNIIGTLLERYKPGLKIHRAAWLNREVALKTLAYSLLESEKFKDLSFLKGERGLGDYGEVHKFLFPACGKDMCKQSNLNDQQVWKRFKGHLQDSSSNEIRELSQKIDSLILELGANNICILDVGWNGTVQSFLQRYTDNRKMQMIWNGLYVGFRIKSRRKEYIRGESTGWILRDVETMPDADLFIPDIWEYIMTEKDYGVKRENNIGSHMVKHFHDILLKTKLTPMDHYSMFKKDLYKYLQRPNRDTVALFGPIKVQSNFDTSNQDVSLVDSSKSRHDILFLLFFHPIKFTNYVSQSYVWSTGLMAYFHISAFAKPLVRTIKLSTTVTKFIRPH